MAQVFAPGVAESRVLGKIVTNNWAVVLHWGHGSTGSWTQAQMQTLADQVMTAWKTRLLPLQTANTTVNSIQTVDLTDAVQRSALSTVAGSSGTMTGSALPIGTSQMINFKIAQRYRGGHPRCYLPPPSISATSDMDTLTAPHVATLQTAFTNFVSDVVTGMAGAGTTGVVHVVPRYTYSYNDDPNKHKYTKERSGFLGTFTVSAYQASNQIRSQRRRFGK